MKHKFFLLKSVLILILFLLIHCGGISPVDPTGFGVWSEDCTAIAVAVNQEDFDGRPLMNHSTNERCDLYLCDSTGEKTAILFTSRTVDGHPTRIDSLEYNAEEGYIVIYSLLYGTGTIKKEKITIAGKKIEPLDTIDVMDWGISQTIVSAPCNSRCITWDYEKKWIVIGEEYCR